MPNHVTTKISALREVVLALSREFTAEERAAWEEREARTAAFCAEKNWPHEPRPVPERIADFELVVSSPPNKEQGDCRMSHEPGVICWHEWNVANWGTKWNAYDNVLEDDIDGMMRISFDTAWSHPRPVILALSKMFPTETIRVVYADEDLGYNVGAYEIRNGEILKENIPEGGSEEAKDLAAMTKYGMTYAAYQKQYGDDDDD